MTEYLLPLDSLYNESEFNAGSGACGPTILAAQGRWRTKQRAPSASQAMQQMIAWGLASATGVTTLGKLATAAAKYGFAPKVRSAAMRTLGPTYVSGLSFAARSLMGLAGYPAPGISCVFLGKGQALVDYLSGQGQDAVNLQGHFIGLIGYNSGGWSNYLGCNVPAGFFAIDGDNGIVNPVVSGVGRIHRAITPQFCYYPTTVLRTAQASDVYTVSR